MNNRTSICGLLAVLLPSILLISACGKVRYPANYILNFLKPTAYIKAPQGGLGTILVREFRCPEYLCRGPIVYRPSPEEVGFYEYHRWAVNPSQSVTQLMAETLQAQSLFGHVALYEREIEAAYVLNGQIERLEEVDNGRNVVVVCAISAELFDTRAGSIVWNDRASETLSVQKRNVRGVVNALTVATQTTVEHLVKSMATRLSHG